MDLSNPESKFKKWWSFFNSVRGREIPHLSQLALKTKCSFFIPREKGAFYLSSRLPSVNLCR